MTPVNKISARNRIMALHADGLTNLWHGMLEGIKMFDDYQRHANTASAIMVLTDGQPNQRYL